MLARTHRRVPPRSATAIDAYIGAQTRKRRLVLKMSQADIAKILGISTQQIQKYEAGRTASAQLGCSTYAGF
jgi:predicted transcriptional regulator